MQEVHIKEPLTVVVNHRRVGGDAAVLAKLTPIVPSLFFTPSEASSFAFCGASGVQILPKHYLMYNLC